MRAIEGLWDVARALGEKMGLAGVTTEPERAALEAEALARMMDTVLLRVREGIEAEIDQDNSRGFDGPRTEVLYRQVLARFHQRHRRFGGIARALKAVARIGATLWTAHAGQLSRVVGGRPG